MDGLCQEDIDAAPVVAPERPPCPDALGRGSLTVEHEGIYLVFTRYMPSAVSSDTWLKHLKNARIVTECLSRSWLLSTLYLE